jgi:hypothetical protein
MAGTELYSLVFFVEFLSIRIELITVRSKRKWCPFFSTSLDRIERLRRMISCGGWKRYYKLEGRMFYRKHLGLKDCLMSV